MHYKIKIQYLFKKYIDKLSLFGYILFQKPIKLPIIMEQKIKKLVNIEQKGRKLVTYLRIKARASWKWPLPPDFSDYKHPRILAIIPCWKDERGNLTSIETGRSIYPRGDDQVRPESPGVAYHFADGLQIVYTRGWKDGKYQEFFTEKTCRDCECVNICAFGE